MCFQKQEAFVIAEVPILHQNLRFTPYSSPRKAEFREGSRVCRTSLKNYGIP